MVIYVEDANNLALIGCKERSSSNLIQHSEFMVVNANYVDFTSSLVKDTHTGSGKASISSPVNQLVVRGVSMCKDVAVVNLGLPSWCGFAFVNR